MRERIRSIWRESKEPLAALWQWAKGDWKRWRALTKFAKHNQVAGRKRLAERDRRLKRERERLDALRFQVHEIHEGIANLRREREEEQAKPRPSPAKLRVIDEKLEAKLAELALVRDRVDATVRDINQGERAVHEAKERLRFWKDKHTTYRKQWRQARKKWLAGQKPAFEIWMLNGRSGNIDEDLKPIIVDLVVGRGQTITDTYDYSGHSSGSYHYPYNNEDGQGHAVDWAGADMAGAMNFLVEKYGQAKFWEQFGPAGYYIKYGARYSGTFPGHYDHGHTAVA